MHTKIIIYMCVTIIVIFAFDSININPIFKKNKVLQARIFICLLALSIIYLISNFIYDCLTLNFI